MHDAHKDLLTVGAADDDARRLDVNVDPSHRVDGAAARAGGQPRLLNDVFGDPAIPT
jgi:hypothetical protein